PSWVNKEATENPRLLTILLQTGKAAVEPPLEQLAHLTAGTQSTPPNDALSVDGNKRIGRAFAKFLSQSLSVLFGCSSTAHLPLSVVPGKLPILAKTRTPCRLKQGADPVQMTRTGDLNLPRSQRFRANCSTPAA